MWAIEAGQMCNWERLLQDDETCCECTTGMTVGPTIGQCLGGYTDDVEVMQWIGLKDNTGKDIYEGDILSITYEENHTVWEVVFCEDHSQFRIRFPSDTRPIAFWSKGDRIKIIGNIHENPELLEQVKE